MKLGNISNQLEYNEFKNRFKRFIKQFESFIVNYNNYEEFVTRGCECCHRVLAGKRYVAIGTSIHNNEINIEQYQICEDCTNYTTFGELDGLTMNHYNLE